MRLIDADNLKQFLSKSGDGGRDWAILKTAEMCGFNLQDKAEKKRALEFGIAIVNLVSCVINTEPTIHIQKEGEQDGE